MRLPGSRPQEASSTDCGDPCGDPWGRGGALQARAAGVEPPPVHAPGSSWTHPAWPGSRGSSPLLAGSLPPPRPRAPLPPSILGLLQVTQVWVREAWLGGTAREMWGPARARSEDRSERGPGSPGQVARGSRDDSSPQEPCYPLRNMISKSRWKLLAMLALVLVVMVWYSISREDRYIELFYFPIPEKKEPCFQGEAERKASKLFGNYSRDQPIFLQLKDYFWVKTPSAYELPYGTKGSEDLLLRVLAITSYSIPESIQSLKCRRCVVVGNGHRLRNSSLGDAINKYDVVIRLNNAPVAGYEGDVGSKTTMRLFYPESAHFNPKVENNPDTLLVLVAFKAMDFHWIETILSDKKRVRKGFWKQPPLIWDVNPRQIRILNPFFMEIAADKLLSLPMKQPRKIKQKPTTGLLAITLALHLCDLVHIAGFGYPDAHNRKQTIHYYEQITLKSMAGSGHNVSQEALAIKRMLEIGAVKNLTFF